MKQIKYMICLLLALCMLFTTACTAGQVTKTNAAITQTASGATTAPTTAPAGKVYIGVATFMTGAEKFLGRKSEDRNGNRPRKDQC